MLWICPPLFPKGGYCRCLFLYKFCMVCECIGGVMVSVLASGGVMVSVLASSGVMVSVLASSGVMVSVLTSVV